MATTRRKPRCDKACPLLCRRRGHKVGYVTCMMTTPADSVVSPLISMLSVLLKAEPSLEVTLMYSTKLPSESPKPEEVLFLPRILELFSSAHALSNRERKNRIELFFTGLGEDDDYPNFDGILSSLHTPDLPIVISQNRMASLDVSMAVGSKEEQRSSVFYVCGPPDMTDEITKFIQRHHDVDKARVLCEKWW
jgi:ferredoxin-NADP reductase